MLPFVLLLASGLALPGPDARAQVYRCESDSGVPVYQGTPSGRNCRALDLAPLTTIPAPKLPAPKNGSSAANDGGGRDAGRGQPARDNGGSAGAAGGSAGAPSGFPRVDGATQRARDNDRRQILEDELEKEESRLQSLRAEYNGGEPERLGDERNYQKYLDRVEQLKVDISRSEANIASLKRELSAIRE